MQEPKVEKHREIKDKVEVIVESKTTQKGVEHKDEGLIYKTINEDV